MTLPPDPGLGRSSLCGYRDGHVDPRLFGRPVTDARVPTTAVAKYPSGEDRGSSGLDLVMDRVWYECQLRAENDRKAPGRAV